MQLVLKMKKTINIKLIVSFILFTILALAAVGLILWQGLQPFFGSIDIFSQDPQKIVKKITEKARALDGVYINRLDEEKYPVAVMIDNKYEAMPWSGLSYANFVFEAPVEGGLTRFLAIYSTDREIEKIGPVRSVRPYFIDWAMEFGAILAHCGGSPKALAEIQNSEKIRSLNLDEFSENFYFWRAGDRFAPHNLYTSSDRLDRARDEKLDSQKLTFSSWQFKDEAFESERGDTKQVRINFGIYKSQDAIWKYDKNKNFYVRYYGAKVSQDDSGSLILAKNIAVMETDIWVIDSLSRRKITTIGSGDALVFQDGLKIEATWEKKSQDERLRFYDKSGSEIQFNRGTTWVEVVSELGRVSSE